MYYRIVACSFIQLTGNTVSLFHVLNLRKDAITTHCLSSLFVFNLIDEMSGRHVRFSEDSLETKLCDAIQESNIQ